MEALDPLGRGAAQSEGRGDGIGNVRATERNGEQPDQHAAGIERDIGNGRAHLDQRDAQLTLFLAKHSGACRDRRSDDAADTEIGGRHGLVDIAHRRAIGEDHVDVDAQPLGMQPDRLLDPGCAIERVERGLRVQHHASAGLDRLATRSQQMVDIVLVDPPAAQIDLDPRDRAGEPARSAADMDMVDVEPRDPLGLFHRFAHRQLGRRHVGDIAALDALAGALASAQHQQLARVGAPDDHRADLGRADIERAIGLLDPGDGRAALARLAAAHWSAADARASPSGLAGVRGRRR